MARSGRWEVGCGKWAVGSGRWYGKWEVDLQITRYMKPFQIQLYSKLGNSNQRPKYTRYYCWLEDSVTSNSKENTKTIPIESTTAVNVHQDVDQLLKNWAIQNARTEESQ